MSLDQSHAVTLSPSTETTCSRIADADQLTRPELKTLFRFWQQKAGGRKAPARTDFDVPELLPWLPHLMLSDLLDDGTDIRFRVVGTWVVEQFGRDDSGKTASEINFAGRCRAILDEYNLVASQIVPHSIRGPFFKHTGTRRFRSAERLILPLSNDGETCSKLLTGIYFLDS